MKNVCQVLHAADFLIVPSASHLCSTFLMEHLKPSNVLGVESTAKRFGLKKVADDSFEFALDHLEAVASCEEFADISVERLTKLLGDDRINVKEVAVSTLFVSVVIVRCTEYDQIYSETLSRSESS